VNATARLRLQAARTDAAFAALERQAEAALWAIRQRNAIDSSEKVLSRLPTSALEPCLHCLSVPAVKVRA